LAVDFQLSISGRLTMRIIYGVICAFIFVLAAASSFSFVATGEAFAADGIGRFALVIGNSRYPDGDRALKDVANDSRDIADELTRDKFDVETGVNLTRDAMQRALDRLYGKIRQDSVVLIFFGGFGIQSSRQTYLIPVDAQIWTEPDVRRDGFALEDILGEMQRRGASVKIALLDASRRNPFERRFRPYSAGLAPVIAPNNSLVMYSAGLGSVINEAETEHGVFVNDLLREIRVPGASAEQTLTNTRAGVTHASQGQQVPWLSSSMAIDFSFTPGTDRPPDKPPEKKTGSDCVRPQPPGPPDLSEIARDPAIVQLSRRLALNRNDQVARFRRGQVYAMKGAFTLAKQDFDEAIRLNPRDFEAYNNRCWTNTATGDLPSAIKDCDEALRLKPGFADALDSRGLVSLKLGQFADAIAEYDTALQTNPRSASSLFGRGIARQRSGVDGSADFDLAKSLDPDIAIQFAGFGVFECER
jgi:tetratricopeptide (TPR) repeat protein